MVTLASARVGPTRCPISSVTSALKKKDSPRSPCNRLPSQITNCWRMGWLKPSRSRISAICAPLALSPAMIAAGSPGVSRSIRNTKIATMPSTGMVASRRRTTKASIVLVLVADPASATRLLGLADVPEERRRALQQARNVVAVRDRLVPLADVGVGADSRARAAWICSARARSAAPDRSPWRSRRASARAARRTASRTRRYRRTR